MAPCFAREWLGRADPERFARRRFLLSIHRGLGDDPRAVRHWPLTFHTLNALCVLAVDIYRAPS